MAALRPRIRPKLRGSATPQPGLVLDAGKSPAPVPSATALDEFTGLLPEETFPPVLATIPCVLRQIFDPSAEILPLKNNQEVTARSNREDFPALAVTMSSSSTDILHDQLPMVAATDQPDSSNGAVRLAKLLGPLTAAAITAETSAHVDPSEQPSPSVDPTPFTGKYWPRRVLASRWLWTTCAMVLCLGLTSLALKYRFQPRTGGGTVLPAEPVNTAVKPQAPAAQVPRTAARLNSCFVPQTETSPPTAGLFPAHSLPLAKDSAVNTPATPSPGPALIPPGATGTNSGVNPIPATTPPADAAIPALDQVPHFEAKVPDRFRTAQVEPSSVPSSSETSGDVANVSPAANSAPVNFPAINSPAMNSPVEATQPLMAISPQANMVVNPHFQPATPANGMAANNTAQVPATIGQGQMIVPPYQPSGSLPADFASRPITPPGVNNVTGGPLPFPPATSQFPPFQPPLEPVSTGPAPIYSASGQNLSAGEPRLDGTINALPIRR
ncbi:MAG: hypothetical protein SFX18_08990 [Pirellulales bacterium]|nr:hypothetical protein [Pirellulales bacterium]